MEESTAPAAFEVVVQKEGDTCPNCRAGHLDITGKCGNCGAVWRR